MLRFYIHIVMVFLIIVLLVGCGLTSNQSAMESSEEQEVGHVLDDLEEINILNENFDPETTLDELNNLSIN